MKGFITKNLTRVSKTLGIFISVLFLFSTTYAQNKIVFVISGPAPSGNGLSWGSPDTSLLQALEDPNLQAGDQIWVASGTYYPGTIGRASSFQMRDGVAVYGGFLPGQNSPSERFDYGPGGTNETILSGDGGISGDSTDNFYHVVTFDNGADSSTILNGFTITKGNADDINSANTYGGGIYNEGSPQIENCAIIDNNAMDDGGGVANFSSNASPSAKYPVFKDCIISGNSSYQAGGILNVAYDASLYPTFINCLITGNSGGSVRDQGDNTGNCLPKFINCTISCGNTSDQIVNSGLRDTLIIENSIVWNYVGYSFYNFLNASTMISYSLIDSPPDSNYIDGGNNVIGQLPLFNNPLSPFTDPSTGGDYHLQASSPALDSGTPVADTGSNNIPSYDIEGNSRPQPLNATNIDMGAYEEDETALMPVELNTFSASVVENKVELKWNTATEVNNYGFYIQRYSLGSMSSSGSKVQNADSGEWSSIGFVKGSGNSNSPKQYSYIDSKPGGGNVDYRLKQIDNDGSFKYSKIVEVSLSEPTKFELMQNYPNPFNPTTTIQYDIPKASYVTLKVYDILGNVVDELVNKEQQPGKYNVQLSAISSQLSSGVYFYQLRAGNYVKTKKMILLK